MSYKSPTLHPCESRCRFLNNGMEARITFSQVGYSMPREKGWQGRIWP